MGGRPQKREKASGRKGWGELGSTWNVKLIHVGIGIRCPRFTLSSFYAVLVLRCPRFMLGRGLVDLVGLVGLVGLGYGFRVEAGDAVTLRWC